jgi:ribose/xylose/arabinose/galactoside ABC-type transport system permease subunit
MAGPYPAAGRYVDLRPAPAWLKRPDNGVPMGAILTILAFLVAIVGLNFFEFGRGD